MVTFLIWLGGWVFQMIMSYVIMLYWEFLKAKKNRSAWQDRSFAEWLYDGDTIQWDEPYIWFSMLLPYFGWLVLVLTYFMEFHLFIGDNRNFNPVRGFLKLCFRKKYLMDRVSKEV